VFARCLRIAVTLALAGLAAAGARADWHRADTDHFVIFSDGSARELERFAQDTERFDALLRQFFRLPASAGGENRLTIYAVRSTDEIARLMGRGETSIAGFYRSRGEGSFAVTNRERTNTKFALSGQTTLFHEYAHHFMFRHLTAAYPAWYVEGFAEYFSTVEFDKQGRWDLGKPAYHRARSLLGNHRLDLDQLLFGTTEGMTRIEVDLYYGRAWMLVHMAMSDPEKGRQLQGYLRDFANGVEPRVAAERNFGSLDDLEETLENYVNESLRFRSSSTPLPYEGRLDIRTLSGPEGDLVDLRLERLMETDLERTREELLELAAESPAHAGVWYELALTELALSRSVDAADGDKEGGDERSESEEVGDDPDAPSPQQLVHEAAARQAIEKALAADPQHVRARVEQVRFQMRDLTRADDLTTRSWSPLRQALLEAHRTDPRDPQPLFVFYDSFRQTGLAAPDIARTAIGQAFTLAPESSRLRMAYVNDLVAHDEIPRAIALLKALAYNPHGGGGALEFLEELEDHLAERTSAETGAGQQTEPTAP